MSWATPLAASATLLCSGCWASHVQTEALARTDAAHDERLRTLEAGLEGDRAALSEKLAETERVLEEAGRVLRRNSADQGLRIERMEQELAEARGEIAEARHVVDSLTAETTEHRRHVDIARQQIADRLDEIARAAGMDAPARPDEIPARADDHFTAAERLLRAGEHSRARALLRAFVARHGSDARADDAQRLVGVSYLRQGQPAAALGELRRVLTEHRGGDVVDRALFDMADAFARVGSCDDARDALSALLSAHARSRLAGRARTRLRELTRDGCDDG